jgi:lambda family phage tail tape measure protein
MASDQDLKYRLLVSVVGGGAVDSLSKQVKGLGDSSKTVVSQFSALGTALKGFAAAFAVKEIVGFGKGIIDAADEMRDLSQRAGVSVNDLSGFKVAAEQSGVSVDILAVGFKKLNQNLAEAAAGNDAAISRFKKLGVAFEDAAGNARPAGDVIKDLSDKFATFKDGPEKAAAAVQLFGKAGDQLIPFLNNGSDALSKFSGLFSQDFADRADQLNDSFTALGAAIQAKAVPYIERLLPVLQEVLNALLEAPDQSKDFASSMDILGEGIRLVAIALNYATDGLIAFLDLLVTGTRQAIGIAIQLFNGLATAIGGVSQGITKTLSGDFSGAAEAFKDIGSASALAFKDGFDKNVKKVGDDFLDRTKKRLSSSFAFDTALSKNSLLVGSGTTEEILARQKADTSKDFGPPLLSKQNKIAPNIGKESDANAEKYKREKNALDALNKSAAEELAIEYLKADAYKFSDAELEKMLLTKQSEIDITRATKDMTAEGAAEYRKSAEAITEAKLAVIDYKEELKKSPEVGFAKALKDYKEAALDTAKQTEKVFGDAFKGAEDALVSFVKTGKLSFSDLANTIIDDLIHIAVQKAIVAAIGGFGFANGGIMTANGPAAFASGGIMTARGMAPLKSYSSGGIATSPQLALFGEGSKPEAYVPLPDGKRIPVNMQGNSGGGTNVSITVNVESGQSKSKASGEDEKTGRQIGESMRSVVVAELIKQKRPGGLLA